MALWRVVGLGLVLFGLVFTHVASPETTSRHLGAGNGVVAAGPTVDVGRGSSVVAEVPREQGHRHPPAHTVEECALGQPPQGPGVDLPCLSPLDSAWRGDAPVPPHAQRFAGRDLPVPIAHAAESTILRV
ncbi:hypothetical protein DEJ49_03020 [Streptomyces venezuelae]|uniref:Uncharacterized protein n=1 Tax=Streptomyces venezuelae TaxID=54571 RepID=A0A5P2CBE4_STRVZ|nr:hypothetical protein DEJ49_03020 [Streptomyces venezuelae]